MYVSTKVWIESGFKKSLAKNLYDDGFDSIEVIGALGHFVGRQSGNL